MTLQCQLPQNRIDAKKSEELIKDTNEKLYFRSTLDLTADSFSLAITLLAHIIYTIFITCLEDC